MSRRRQLSVADHVQGVLDGDRAILGRTITLVESNNPEHRAMAQQVLVQLTPHAGGARRIGVSGVPGVGKSTFIEAMGCRLVDEGRRVAVLAVDPTSTLRGGSILGDKTRMGRLSIDPAAFVRPSPTGGTLGGVHRKTRESLLVCEAAGFDVVIVETVGVGQSEVSVAAMVDVFLVLLLAGAGDELQGIKKGILEVADVLAVNKADGDNVLPARRAAAEVRGALRFVHGPSPHWSVPVLTCSSTTGEGLDAVWQALEDHHSTQLEHGEVEGRRQKQRLGWMWALVEEELIHRLRTSEAVQAVAPALERGVLDGQTTPTLAALEILSAFGLAPPDEQ